MDSVPKGSVRGFDIGKKRIMLSSFDDQIFAVDAYCTHERADLSEGIVNGCNIACPLHSSEFDLRTGEVQTPPAETSLRKYDVKLENGEIFVQI